jgi:hypothetical protein
VGAVMKKEDRKLLIYLGVIFLALVLHHPLPHDSYSILRYAVSPIQAGNSTIFLDGIITLILLLIGISGLLDNERLRRSLKSFRLLFILFILIPLMGLFIDFARISYHSIVRDGISSVNIIDSDITLTQINGSASVNIDLGLKNYSVFAQKFSIRIYLPKSLSQYTGKAYYEFNTDYRIANCLDKMYVSGTFPIAGQNTEVPNRLPPGNWQYEDIKYELYNDERTVAIIRHGS